MELGQNEPSWIRDGPWEQQTFKFACSATGDPGELEQFCPILKKEMPTQRLEQSRSGTDAHAEGMAGACTRGHGALSGISPTNADKYWPRTSAHR